jgi:hypothetical protein
MNETDVKVLLMNASTFAISFSQIEMALKITLLVLTIGYTAQRWYIMYKDNKKEE